MRIQTLAQCEAMALLVATVTSCGDVVRSSRSPVILVVSSLQAARGNATTLGSTLSSDVVTLVRTPAPCSATTPCSTMLRGQRFGEPDWGHEGRDRLADHE